MPSPDDRSWGLPQTHVNPAAEGLTLEKLMKARRNLEGRNYVPGDRQLEQMAAEGKTSFINQRLQEQIQHWCHTDFRVDHFWHMLTDRVRSGLNDQIVNGVFQALAQLLTTTDRQLAEARKAHTGSHTWILEAAQKVIDGYEDAARRGDVLYMEAAVEELDAALDDLRERDDKE